MLGGSIPPLDEYLGLMVWSGVFETPKCRCRVWIPARATNKHATMAKPGRRTILRGWRGNTRVGSTPTGRTKWLT